MANQQVLIPSSNVEGNITSCKIENQLKGIEKDSLFSLQVKNTYMTYDVCNKAVIHEYTVPEFSFLGGAIIIPGIFMLFFAAWVILSSINDHRKGTFGNEIAHF